MSVFKKRPKRFFGTRRQDLPGRSPPHSSEAESEIERPIPVVVSQSPAECASSKKFALSRQFPVGPYGDLRSASHPSTSSAGESESLDYVGKMKGYRLVSCETLSQAVSEIGVCSVCASLLTVKEDLVARRGLVSKLMICCANTACNKEAAVSDPYASDSKSLNTRSVLGMREIGRGRNSLESFCGIMDLPPPLSIPAYRDHNRRLAKISMECAGENMLAACLHQLRGVPCDEIIDIAVTCDGTWSKRGFTAMYGVVAVIAWETGQVLDFEIMSKRCSACSRKLHTVEETSDEFKDWWETHKGV